MTNSTKQNFNYANVNEFAAKKTLFIFILCFIVSIGYSRSKRNHFVHDKKITHSTLHVSANLVKAGDKNKKSAADTLEECLEVTGQFDANAKAFTGFYNVKLILENTVVATQTISVKKGFGFVLLKNMHYTIKIEKEGFIPRIFSVSTMLNDKLDEKDSYVFSFETSLLSQDLTGLFTDDDVDFPFALINYNKSCDCFEHSKEYTASLIQGMINHLIYGI